jgi:hypothetical protein
LKNSDFVPKNQGEGIISSGKHSGKAGNIDTIIGVEMPVTKRISAFYSLKVLSGFNCHLLPENFFFCDWILL